MSFASQSLFGEHELIQAMPLDSDKVTNIQLSGDTPETVVALRADTRLVEVSVQPYEAASTIPLFLHVGPVTDGGLKGVYLPPGKSTYTVAPLSKSGEPQTITLYCYGLIQPTYAFAQILEA